MGEQTDIIYSRIKDQNSYKEPETKRKKNTKKKFVERMENVTISHRRSGIRCHHFCYSFDKNLCRKFRKMMKKREENIDWSSFYFINDYQLPSMTMLENVLRRTFALSLNRSVPLNRNRSVRLSIKYKVSMWTNFSN